jgi:hypothetical protein
LRASWTGGASTALVVEKAWQELGTITTGRAGLIAETGCVAGADWLGCSAIRPRAIFTTGRVAPWAVITARAAITTRSAVFAARLGSGCRLVAPWCVIAGDALCRVAAAFITAGCIRPWPVVTARFAWRAGRPIRTGGTITCRTITCWAVGTRSWRATLFATAANAARFLAASAAATTACAALFTLFGNALATGGRLGQIKPFDYHYRDRTPDQLFDGLQLVALVG